MMALMRLPIYVLLAALPILPALAQDSLPDESLEPRSYTVEMIIFKYAQDVGIGSEIFPAEEPPFQGAVFEDEVEPFESEPMERTFHDIEMVLLPRDRFTMGDIMDRLSRLDVYQPLMHFAWTQATWPDENTLPIDLGKMGRTPAGLSGTLRLYLSRYLHLVVDLELDAPEQLAINDSRGGEPSRYGDVRPSGESASKSERYDFAPNPVRYRIEENRILKTGEVRYFDHPKFGVLAKVMRVEDEQDESVESDESELLGYPAE